jgi:hypothetical protein
MAAECEKGWRRKGMQRSLQGAWEPPFGSTGYFAAPEVADADHPKVAHEDCRGGFGAAHFGK